MYSPFSRSLIPDGKRIAFERVPADESRAYGCLRPRQGRRQAAGSLHRRDRGSGRDAEVALRSGRIRVPWVVAGRQAARYHPPCRPRAERVRERVHRASRRQGPSTHNEVQRRCPRRLRRRLLTGRELDRLHRRRAARRADGALHCPPRRNRASPDLEPARHAGARGRLGEYPLGHARGPRSVAQMILLTTTHATTSTWLPSLIGSASKRARMALGSSSTRG